MTFREGGNSRKLAPLHSPHHSRDMGNEGGAPCVDRRKREHGSSTHPLEIPCPGCTLPSPQILPAPPILSAPTSCLLPAFCLMSLPHPGMRASTAWCVTASLTPLSQNLECCKHRSASPCFQHSCEQRSLGSLVFFVSNQRNSLQILPSQNCAMTFFTAWRGSLKFWPLFPLPVTGHRGWPVLVSGDASSSDGADVVALGWCCNGRSGAPWTMAGLGTVHSHTLL